MLFETGRICYKNDVNIVQVFFQLYYFLRTESISDDISLWYSNILALKRVVAIPKSSSKRKSS